MDTMKPVRRITSLLSAATVAMAIAVSPVLSIEGTAIVTYNWRPWLVNMATGVKKQLIDQQVTGLCFSPDGKRVAYVRESDWTIWTNRLHGT